MLPYHNEKRIVTGLGPTLLIATIVTLSMLICHCFNYNWWFENARANTLALFDTGIVNKGKMFYTNYNI
jgi:hypothetical protein